MISEWLGVPAAPLAWGFALYVFIVAPPTRGACVLMAMLLFFVPEELRLKFNVPFCIIICNGLKRGTVAPVFVATFFVISHLAGSFLSSQFGNVLGVLGTGALAFSRPRYNGPPKASP